MRTEPVTLDAVEEMLRGMEGGALASIRTGSDRVEALVLFPRAFVDAAARAVAAKSGARQAGDALGEMVSSVSASFEVLAALRLPARGAAEGADAGAGDDRLPPEPTLVVRRRYQKTEREELLWRVAECLAYRVCLDDSALYVFIDVERDERLRRALGGSAAFGDALEAALDPAVTASSGPELTSLAVRSPRELCAGSLFVPFRVACGAHVIQARLRSVAVGASRELPEGAGTSPGVWVASTCTFGATAWATYSFFPARDPKRAAALPGTARQLVACQFRESLREASAALKAKPELAAVALGARPTPAAKAGFVVLDWALCVSGLNLSCETWVSEACLAVLGAAALDPWDWREAKRSRPAQLAAVMALSEGMLRGRLPSLHRGGLEAQGKADLVEADSPFPFSAFMDLVGDRDLRVALQNQVLLSVGALPLRALFSYAESVSTPGAVGVVRTVTPCSFDEQRLVGFLPRRAAEEWSGRAAQLPDKSGYQELNARVLADIRAAAARGHLVLTRRARYVLERMYRPIVQAQAQDLLLELTKARVPFAELEKLAPPRIQEILGRESIRSISLALLGAEADMALVRANTSRAKNAQIVEELGIVRRQTAEGVLDPEECVEAKRGLAEAIRLLVEAQKKQRTPGGPARPVS